MAQLKQSAAYTRMVLMVSATDHITGLAGATLTINASKAGGAFAVITPTVTDRGNGWYSLALTAAHTDTLGDLALRITATGADPTDVLDQVTAQDPNVANVPANVVQVNGAAQTARDLGAQLDAAVSSRMASFTLPANFAAMSLTAAGRVDVGSVSGTVQTARDLGGQLDAAISSRMASFTLPANFSAFSLTAAGRVDVAAVAGTAQTARDLGANLDATVSSRLATAGYTAPPAATAIATAVWDALTTAITTVGSIGVLLKTNVDALISSRLATAGYTAPDNATITTINSKLPALVGGRLDASVGAYQTGMAPLQPTTAGRTLDVSAGGEAGLDWANIGGVATTVNFSGTTINTVTNAGSVSLPTTTRTGAIQAAAAGTVTLDAGASAVTDFYVGQLVILTSGSGVGQVRRIMAYNGTSKVATLNRNWATTPAAADTFVITADDRVDLSHVQGTAQTARDLGGQLDAAVSSRMATFTLPANFSAFSLTAAGRVDVAAVAGTAQTARDLGAQLDATVSSRMATFSLPTNFGALSVTAAGRVDVAAVAGTTQTARDLGANLDTTVSSRLATAGYTTPPTASAIATAVWDALTAAITTVGSIGVLLKTNVDALISSRMAAFTLPTNFAALGITAAGRVDVGSVSGTAQTARDLGGQLDATISSRMAAGATVGANLTQIMGVALTGTAAQVAASFSSFYNVAAPTGTVNSLPAETPGAANGLLRGGSNPATSFAGFTANITGDLSGSVASVTGSVGSVAGNVSGSVGSVTGAVGSVTSRVTANTDQIGGANPSTTIRDAVLNGVIEGTTTLAQFLRGIIAVLLGKAAGMNTTTATFRDQADSKDRVTATVDQHGNRTSVTTDLT